MTRSTTSPDQLGLITCGLCGQAGTRPDEILRRLTRWTTEAAAELGKPQHDVVDRCRDEVACRERVELGLEVPWPLDDRTPAPARQPLPSPVATAPDAGRGVKSSAIAAQVGPHGSHVSGDSRSNVSAPLADEEIEWLR